MKRTLPILLLILTGWLMSWLLPSLRSPLTPVRSFMFYYDHPNDSVMNELKSVDLAILAVHAFSKEQIQEIQASGTLVYGYTSLMQLENWNTAITTQVQDSDYAIQNEQKIYVEEWDTYVMDVREAHYQQILLTKIQEEQQSKGIDGVFFDTADDLFHYFSDTPDHDSFLEAYESILKQVDDLQLGIVQNRGFESYEARGKPYIDAILWENFSDQTLAESSWAQNWFYTLLKAHHRKTIRLLAEVRTDESETLSRNLGFPTYRKY